MGRRGPGARHKQAVETPETAFSGPFAWEDDSLPMPERIIAFAEALPITSGMHAGQNVLFREWQKAFIRRVYGPLREDGRRRVRTALFSLPRKNGKTAICAILALAHLCGPAAERRGQVFSAAADRDQASLIFNEMRAMIEATPWLESRCNIQQFRKAIEDDVTGSVYQAMSSDARKAHGLSPSFVICDELAQWKNRELYDNLVTGTGARAEPLVVVIGTQAKDDQHLMSELVDYGQKVIDGEVDDPTFSATIYRAPEDADPWALETWEACNPALGDFRSLEEMETFAEQAQRIPAREAVFRNLYLNQRVDSEVRFIAAADWQRCAGEIDPVSLYGKPCYVGLDLSSTRDLTAAVAFFPDGGEVVPFFFVPGDNMREREDTDRVPYVTWQKEGLLTATRGRAVDKKAVAQRLAQLCADYDVKAVAYDRWRMEDLKRILDDEGINLPLVGFGQGFQSMSPALDAMETLVLDGKLNHGGHPVLTWNCSNCVVDTDPAGNRKLSKKRSREKIDGMVALIMAIGVWSSEQKQEEIIINDNTLFVVSY